MAVLEPPFDDSTPPAAKKQSTDPSTITSDVDPFRYGVDITSPTHYARGIVKARAGFNESDVSDHTIPQVIIGASKKKVLDQLYFNDVLPMAAKNVVGNVVVESSSIVVNSDGDPEVDAFVTDGVLEPLTIRRIISKLETTQDAAHKIWGLLDEGNVVDRERTDRFVIVVKLEDLSNGSYPFEDAASVMGTKAAGAVKTSGEILSVDNRVVGAFEDDQGAKGVMLSSDMSGDVVTALNKTSPDTDNIQPPSYVQPGRSGFEYGR